MKFKVLCTPLSGLVHMGCTLCQVFLWLHCTYTGIPKLGTLAHSEVPDEMRHNAHYVRMCTAAAALFAQN